MSKCCCSNCCLKEDDYNSNIATNQSTNQITENASSVSTNRPITIENTTTRLTLSNNELINSFVTNNPNYEKNKIAVICPFRINEV